MNIWEKSTPGRWHSTCKGPVAGACVACSEKDREAGVSGWGRRRTIEEDVSKVVKDQATEGPMEHGKGF